MRKAVPITITEELADIFWRNLKKTDGCWVWFGRRVRNYGFFYIKGRNLRAHRVSWVIHFGQIPDGMYVCHHCDNPPCVNPKHLFLGTQSDNIRDAVKKKRIVSPWANGKARGELSPRSKLKDAQVHEMRRLISKGVPYRTIGRQFNVSATTVLRVKKGACWSHI